MLYGLVARECVQLEVVDAEENERVQQMRRDEQEAEEYERAADALFADRRAEEMAAPPGRKPTKRR